jgi:hypothetical protein
MASIRFENTIDIDLDRARVFAYLADIERTPAWNWAIASSRQLTPGPVAVGTRFRLERTAPQRAIEELEVTVLQPGERLEVAGRLGPFDARLSYELRDVPSGTRLVNKVELNPATSLGFLGGLVGGRIRGAVAENLAALKVVLESDASRHDGDTSAQ